MNQSLFQRASPEHKRRLELRINNYVLEEAA
jgi:hypothetical protein